MATIAELYLAFRQAKTALFFEKRGVGLSELAAYERNLYERLFALNQKLSGHSWFDTVEIGEVHLVPKRLRRTESSDASFAYIGSQTNQEANEALELQLRLSPTIDFAIVETLYLWRFGGGLDGLLPKAEVLGNRLHVRKGNIIREKRWLFEYWPASYEAYRNQPLDIARRLLRNQEAIVITADLERFYENLDPSFMIEGSILDRIAAFSDNAEREAYIQATRSLLAAYSRFREAASSILAVEVPVGIPIGALTSRLVANLALLPLDEYVLRRADLVCYRRYVDDVTIVAKATNNDQDLLRSIARFFPVLKEASGTIELNPELLNRQGCTLRLQQKKVRVHRLSGDAGIDFVNAVRADFAHVVSERRAFLDESTLLRAGAHHLIRARESSGSQLRALRNADRVKLERYALSTSLHSLERISRMVNADEARSTIRRALVDIGRVLHDEGEWIADFEVSLRLLKLAIVADDKDSTREQISRFDSLWGSLNALKVRVCRLHYGDITLDEKNHRAWKALRAYAHMRRLEAVCSVLPLGDSGRVKSLFEDGIRFVTRTYSAEDLERMATKLADTDLRALDKEEDNQVRYQSRKRIDRRLVAELEKDSMLRERFQLISKFTLVCAKLGDRSWNLTASTLFLCTRPPSYFDIARRLLYKIESGLRPNLFRDLLDIVNAVRGTNYQDPVGSVEGRAEVRLDFFGNSIGPTTEDQTDPRIILGNLSVPDAAWSASAEVHSTAPKLRPLLTIERLKAVAKVLLDASRAAKRGAASILVLPELSIPREWFRPIAAHVVSLGRFGLVTGLEYLHDLHRAEVRNQVFAVLPGPFGSAVTWPWTKRFPAREERDRLAALPNPRTFPPTSRRVPRVVVRSSFGDFSVLICSELIEARRVADLLGRVNLVLCPAWNTDTASYDHLLQSVGFQLHSIIAIANNGKYSDCRAWAPRSERWQRDLCRLIERDINGVVQVDIPLSELKGAHHWGRGEGWKPLPPDWG